MNYVTGNLDSAGITEYINIELGTNEENWKEYYEWTRRGQSFFVSDSGLTAFWFWAGGNILLSTRFARTEGSYLRTMGKIRGRSEPMVHQVVWDTFGTGPVAKGMVIDHIDENKQNNHIDNLQILTIGENVSKSLKGARRAGDNNPNSRAYKQKRLLNLQL